MKKFLITILLFNTYLLNAQTIWRAPAVFKEWASFNNNFTITHSTDTIGICYGLFGKNGMGFKSHNTTDTAFIGFTDVYGTKIPILISKKDSSFTQIGARSGGGFFVADSNAIINKSCAYFGSSDTIGYTVDTNSFYWPRIDGNPGYALTTDGAGNLNFSSITNSAWGLTGNTGATLTDSTTNFIGSAFQFPFIAKTNNIERYRITSNGLHAISLPVTSETGIDISANSLTGGSAFKISSTSFTGSSSKLLNITASGSTTVAGMRYGLYINTLGAVAGNSTDQTYFGQYTVVGSGNSINSKSYGTYAAVVPTSLSAAYGVYGDISPAGSSIGNTYAGYFDNRNANGNRYGIYAATATGAGSAFSGYGVYGVGATSNSGAAYGVYGTTTGSQSSANYYGVYGLAGGSGSSVAAYGVYGNANSSTPKNIGGYFTATNGTVNYGLIVANGSVGVGTTAPTAQVHIVGTGATSSTFSLKILNSAATSLLQVRNDGVSAFASLDSATAYALTTPPAGGIVYCNNCTGNGITGRLLAYIASAWRRLTFE